MPIFGVARPNSGRASSNVVAQVLVEMERGYLLVGAVSGGAAIGVVATRTCDLGLVGYEMALLVQRVGQQLTPALVTELKHSLAEA